MTTYDNGEPVTIYPPTNIRQTARERVADLIRAGGIDWKRTNDPNWRDAPWLDGIVVDLDEDAVLYALVDYLIAFADPDEPEHE